MAHRASSNLGESGNGSVYEQITNRIIALMEAGTIPWRKPWNAKTEWPRNLVSKKPYRGVNVFLLHAMQYQSPFWLTFNQANQLGLQVGAQGTSGAATAAGVGTEGQNTINQTNTSGVNNLTAANTYLNTGVNANKSASDIPNSGFQDQMTQYQAQSAQDNSTMSALGSVAGAAMMFMEGGGSVPATHIGGAAPGRGARAPMAHSGLPVVHGAVRPRQAAPFPFEPMFSGGPVTAKGALPVGSIPGTTDRKPAILTPGEFVIPKDVVDHLGTEKLHKLVDSTRQNANKRRAIPVNHPPHMSLQ